jgi:16S rRNA processing protein RimM
MLLLAHLAKIQGLKGEFLLHEIMDEPEKLEALKELILAPPEMILDHAETAPAPARAVTLRLFRWHQDRACVAFQEIPDRTAAEAFKGWALWMPEQQASLEEGESFRHQWIGCEVYVKGEKVGEVMRLDPTPMGYDMVVMRDLRKGRTGRRDIPFIKAWFSLDLPHRRIDLDPPEGLLELDRLD